MYNTILAMLPWNKTLILRDFDDTHDMLSLSIRGKDDFSFFWSTIKLHGG